MTTPAGPLRLGYTADRMSRLPGVILAFIVLVACQREQSAHQPRSGSGPGADSARHVDACPRVWVWLKDPAEVDRKRGIDLSESNFRILGCREVLEALSKADLDRMARELDTLVEENRSKFETDWHDEGYRRQVTTRLNGIVGRPIVEDWSADLWQMTC